MTDAELDAVVRHVTYVARRAHMAGTDSGNAHNQRLGREMTLAERKLDAEIYVRSGFDHKNVRAMITHYLDHPNAV